MSTQPSSKIIINIKDDNRPYAEVEIYGTKIIGLLDSGAQASVARAGFIEIIRKLKYETYIYDS